MADPITLLACQVPILTPRRRDPAFSLLDLKSHYRATQARADELQRQAQELRADLERLQAGERTEVERLAGEMAALKDQVAQVLARQQER